ncbi:S-layer homology domain-containing protein [Bacillus mobilis]|uniref:S-layer homology domain-containing protein n=1 Tax=Bacillus mobilis TaxID=2026190 RepID=UPI002E218695|nr:S-layer homology domain-containing protein [Bacillus mobilis]
MDKLRKSISIFICTLLLVSTLEMNAMIPNVAAAKLEFSDVPKNHWAEKAIYELVDKNITVGIGGGKYGIENPVTRGQFATFISLALDLPDGDSSFPDVPKEHMFYKGISKIVQVGIAKGSTDGNFYPEDNITRQDISVMLSKALELKGLTNKKDLLFIDKDQISDYALESIKNVVAYDIARGVGDNKFAPKDKSTRAMAATLIYNLINVLKIDSNSSEVEKGTNQNKKPDNGTNENDKTNMNKKDTDGDGLPDIYEINNSHTDPNKKDTDGNGIFDGLEDLDNDGLSNIAEFKLKTDPLKADTDGDGLLDGTELMLTHTNPLLQDSDKNGVMDGNEDPDKDGLSNIHEQEIKTDPLRADTDGDNLLDGQELEKKTNPLKKDSDDDGLDDDSEFKFSCDPNNPDTNGNGVLDGQELFNQTVKNPDLGVSVNFSVTGDAEKSTVISEGTDLTNIIGSTGIIGKSLSFSTTSTFPEAKVSIDLSNYDLGSTSLENVRLFYYNPATQTVEPVAIQTMGKDNVLTATLQHFSTYVLGDISKWNQMWQDGLKPGALSYVGETEKKPVSIAFVIDSSGSMGIGWNNDYNKDINRNRVKGTIELINILTNKDYASVIDFDNRSIVLQDFVNGTDENKKKLKDAADAIDASGGTSIYSGIDQALDLFENHKQNLSGTTKQIILLTDGEDDYPRDYSPEIERAKQMGVKIHTIGLGDSFAEELLKNLSTNTGGDFFISKDSHALVETMFNAGQSSGVYKDSDKDGLPDWVEEKGAYYVKDTFDIVYKTDPNNPDTDGDGLLDGEEIGNWYYNPKDKDKDKDKDKIYITRNMTSQESYKPNTSNPSKKDSDNDGDNDKIDDKPFVAFRPPVVLLHGILSSTEFGWGAEVNKIDNNQSIWRLFNSRDYRADIEENIPSRNTYSGKTYAKGDSSEYSNIDLDYIKNTKRGELARFLEEKTGFEKNKTLFAFNWEANGHINVAGKQFAGYLSNLSGHLKDIPDVDFTKNGQPYYTLVGHSAGGLVSRYYIENIMDNSNPQIEKLITVGTPHWGSNAFTNPGPCGTVMEDLDRDDSYLFYENDPNWISFCPKPKNDQLSLNNKNVKYFALGGIKTDHYYDGNTIEMDIPSKITSSPVDLFKYFQKEFKNNTNSFFPDLLNDELGIENEGGPFGDTYVTGGSSLGIPSTIQKEQETRINTIPLEKRTLFYGKADEVEHTKINHNERTYKWISNNLIK